MRGRGRVSKVLRSAALTQFPRWTPHIADEIPNRKLLTTNVKPVFRSCLFNIAHSGGKLKAVTLPKAPEPQSLPKSLQHHSGKLYGTVATTLGDC
jgi:hypothetical protein